MSSLLGAAQVAHPPPPPPPPPPVLEQVSGRSSRYVWPSACCLRRRNRANSVTHFACRFLWQPTGSGGVDRSIVAGSRGVQLTASVVALSWPTPPKQQARRTPARAPGTPGTVPTEDGHDSDGGADAAAAADSAASGTTSPTTPQSASSPPPSPKQGEGAGAGGGAGGGAGVGAQSPATAASQEPKVVIMHHVAVTRSAGYVVEVCHSAPVMCVIWNRLWFEGNLVVVVVVLVCCTGGVWRR